MTEQSRSGQYEAEFTTARIAELTLHPVQGRFDTRHLQEIHRRIFQDLPAETLEQFIGSALRPL